MFTRIYVKALAAVMMLLCMSYANAALMDIHFTASGSASGAGDLVVDSSLLAPGTFNCCSSVPSGFQSLNLTLDFGMGSTAFHLSDLLGTTYVLSTDGSGLISDLNFWGKNADGVELTGVSPFTESASGSLGAQGTFRYTVASVTPAAAVPEPATLSLLGLGLFGFAMTRRRKR